MVKNAKWTKLRIGQNEKLEKKNGKLDKMEKNYLTISEKFGKLGQTRKVGQNSKFKSCVTMLQKNNKIDLKKRGEPMLAVVLFFVRDLG